jgi:ABC transport system ATP-binding/permease protein
MKKMTLAPRTGDIPPSSADAHRSADSYRTVTSLTDASITHAANTETTGAPGQMHEDANTLELADDSVSTARSPWAGNIGLCRSVDVKGSAETLPNKVADSLAEPIGQPVDADCLQVHSLGLTLPNGRQLLSDVSFTACRGSLSAIIGPSGAGKTTLAKLVAGAVTPTTGEVTFEGHNLHSEFVSLRHRIGAVPQDDVVHHRLTVDEALRYAAQLRLPDATKDERAAAVSRVLEELELTQHARTRIDKLSGGQRKRASVAMELLTGPSLLILDEPTTGLDPALDRQVMAMLRRLADAGRIVLVVTHCLTYLDVCDQVLLLTSAGKTAYNGPPGEIETVMGTTSWADIFTTVGANPEEASREFLKCRQADAPQPAPSGQRAPSSLRPLPCRLLHQTSTVARRQLRLVLADRGYLVFLAVLPFILGTLTALVPGDAGLGRADPRGHTPSESADIMILLNVSAVFMGAALTIRDLIGERTIFVREQRVGLSASAYLMAKIAVFCLIAAAQTAVLTAIVVLGKSAPTRGAVVAGDPVLELYLTLAATAAVSAVMGLAMSAAAKSQDQILPMLVISVMVSLVFAGGFIPVTGRIVFNQLSWAIPARWGFAASASTTDLHFVAPLVHSSETLWTHQVGWWLLDMTALIVLGAVLAGCVRWRIRLNAASQTIDRTAWYRLITRLWRRVAMSRSSLKAWARTQSRFGRFRQWADTPVLVAELATE